MPEKLFTSYIFLRNRTLEPDLGDFRHILIGLGNHEFILKLKDSFTKTMNIENWFTANFFAL